MVSQQGRKRNQLLSGWEEALLSLLLLLLFNPKAMGRRGEGGIQGRPLSLVSPHTHTHTSLQGKGAEWQVGKLALGMPHSLSARELHRVARDRIFRPLEKLEGGLWSGRRKQLVKARRGWVVKIWREFVQVSPLGDCCYLAPGGTSCV